MAGIRRRLSWCRCLSLGLCLSVAGLCAPTAYGQPPLVVSTQLNYFTVNGSPTFLVFFSYFDALRASNATLDSDFAFLRSKGINGIRILPNWLDWGTPPTRATDTLIDASGALRPAILTRLTHVLDRAKAHALIVDVSFTCDTVEGLTHNGYKNGLTAATQALSGD